MAEKRRGRSPGFRMSNEHRVKIQNSNILNALIEHAVGDREMSSTQVQAGLGLLKKCLPDMSSVEVTGNEDNPLQTITRIELVAAGVDGNSED